MSSPKRISIEALLIWAYRDQMVHAARIVPPEMVQGYQPGIARLRAGSDVAVDASVNMGFDAAPDAYLVHGAVTGLAPLRRQLSPEEMGCIKARKMNRDAVLALDRLARGDATDPPAAETVRRSELVMHWAKKAARPDWVRAPFFGFERGRAVYESGADRYASSGRRARFHIVRSIGDDPFEVEHARAIYGVWADSVAALRASLENSLRDFLLTSELPDRAPWIGA